MRLERVAVSGNDRTLLSVAGHMNGGRGDLRLCHVEPGHPLGYPLVVCHTREIAAAAFNKDATVLAAGGCGKYNTFSGCSGELVLWHVHSGTLLAPTLAMNGNVVGVDLNSDQVLVKILVPRLVLVQ